MFKIQPRQIHVDDWLRPMNAVSSYHQTFSSRKFLLVRVRLPPAPSPHGPGARAYKASRFCILPAPLTQRYTSYGLLQRLLRSKKIITVSMTISATVSCPHKNSSSRSSDLLSHLHATCLVSCGEIASPVVKEARGPWHVPVAAPSFGLFPCLFVERERGSGQQKCYLLRACC